MSCGPLKPQPTTNVSHVGIEIEFDVAWSSSVVEMNKFIKASPNLSGAQIDHEYITYQRKAYEATLLAPQTNFEAPLTELVEILRSRNAVLDNDCGLHVHLDMRFRDRDVARGRLNKALLPLLTMCAPRRRHMGGYFATRRYDSLEVRMMEAHFDTPRIIAWIHKLVEVADTPSSEQSHGNIIRGTCGTIGA